MDDDGVRCGDTRLTLTELLAAAPQRGIRFTEARKAYGSPRSVTSNTHGFRIAVHRVTGEIRILYSVQAADAGVVINPVQVRGQIEGGVAQGIGFALTENFHVDGDGVMVNPNLRNYRIPTFADIPRTEVILVESTDSVGPDALQGDGGVLHQPGGACAGQRPARRHRGALPRTAAHPGADLRPARRHRLIAAMSDGRRQRHRQRRDRHHRQRLRAGSEQAFVAWQHGLEQRAPRKYPGIHRRRGHSADRRPAGLGRGLPLRLGRERAGLDQQRHPAGSTGRGRGSTSTARPPSR